MVNLMVLIEWWDNVKEAMDDIEEEIIKVIDE